MTGEAIANPERTLAISYAPPDRRAGLEALLELDEALAQLLRTTREPALGQLRLAWWREALAKLDHEAAPAEPTLQALQRDVLGRGVAGNSLVPIVHGWEVLVEEETLDRAALLRFAEGRGQLFVAGGALVEAGQADPLALAGQGWALADLARNLQNPGEAEEARGLAAGLLESAMRVRWSRNGRALGALAHLARLDLAVPLESLPPIGAPHRVARLFWHRIGGK